jgi:energy-coupling factor transporter ATP-binding protein EcfA2
MVELAESGKGILMITSDMQELLGMSDCILVMAGGSVAAVSTPVSLDTNSDGVTETVYPSAKTDMEFTQGYSPNAPVFLDSVLPFEVAFQNRTQFVLYFQQQPLANQQVEVVSGLGNAFTMTTDDSGASKAVPGLDVIDYGQEDYVFGSAEKDTRHWDVFVNNIFQNSEYAKALASLFNASNDG